MKEKANEQDLDPQVSGVLRRAVEEVAGARPITLEGEEITSADVVSPTFLLPALLVKASEVHAIARAAGAETAFHIDLRSDPDAFLGFRVAGIETTSLAALTLPVIGVLRRGGEDRPNLAMDDVVRTFGEWLVLNGHAPASEGPVAVPEPDVGPEPEMGG